MLLKVSKIGHEFPMFGCFRSPCLFAPLVAMLGLSFGPPQGGSAKRPSRSTSATWPNWAVGSERGGLAQHGFFNGRIISLELTSQTWVCKQPKCMIMCQCVSERGIYSEHGNYIAFFKCARESSGLETVSIVLPRLSHLIAHIIVQANSMGLIPQTGEQHLIENNNLNQNNKQQNKKLKQPKQYNRP